MEAYCSFDFSVTLKICAVHVRPSAVYSGSFFALSFLMRDRDRLYLPRLTSISAVRLVSVVNLRGLSTTLRHPMGGDLKKALSRPRESPLTLGGIDSLFDLYLGTKPLVISAPKNLYLIAVFFLSW